jgi:type II secretory pathway pseudopilin PulG
MKMQNLKIKIKNYQISLQPLAISHQPLVKKFKSSKVQKFRVEKNFSINQLTNHQLTKNKGVTLIELAIVVVIIMTLVLIGSVVWLSRDELASRNGALVSINGLVKAMKMYKADQGDYPPQGAISPLASYTDITRLLQTFRNPPLGGSPSSGIQVFRNSPSNDVACVWGELDDVTGEYEIRYCASTNESYVWSKADNQPTCLWGKGPFARSWPACKDGL